MRGSGGVLGRRWRPHRPREGPEFGRFPTIGAAVGSHSALAPLAIGAALMVMIYAGGHLSGGHYNPAVTLAALIRRRIGVRDAVAYWLSQIGAGLIAALLVRTVIDPTQSAVPAMMPLGRSTLLAAFIVELLFTFALCYVVLNVATSKDHPTNSFYGLAIGFTVLAGAVAVGGISGGAFNPAVTFAGAVMQIFAWPTLWVYLVAQVVAGAVAGSNLVANASNAIAARGGSAETEHTEPQRGNVGSAHQINPVGQ